MIRIFCSIIILWTVVHCFGQGTVHFANYVFAGKPVVNTPFFDESGTPLEGPKYVAQLFVWFPFPTYDFLAVNKAVPFGNNGYFDGGVVILPPPFAPGASVWVQVRAWQFEGGRTFEEAAVAGFWTGTSGIVFISRAGGAGAPPSAPALLTGLEYPGNPLMIRQPQTQSVSLGQRATLLVLASSGVQMSYQWFQQAGDRPDGLIVGATNATYITPPLGTNATFWVSVSNSVGSVLSEKATVTVVSTIPRLVVRPGAASPQLELHGSTGNTYRIEYSPDVSQSHWTSLVEISLRASPFVFTDSNWSNSTLRFYRAVAP
jgi:hypothetical protein